MTHPAVQNAREAIELEERHRRLKQLDIEHAHYRRSWICLMLATTPETWHALMLGQPVHPDLLHPEWLSYFQERQLWAS